MIKNAKDALKLKASFTRKQLTRLPQFRSITDGKMPQLESLREILSPDYQKAFIPYQTGIVAQVMYDMTNIMASNQSEIRYRARSTDPKIVAKVQEHEHGHEALDPILFPIEVVRRMYSFLGDGYTIVALDVYPKPGTLEKYADRASLEKYAEGDGPEDDTADGVYKRAYNSTRTDRTPAERHEDAYEKATTEAMLADGCGVRVRVVDPETFRGVQLDGDPSRFDIGMEYGKKQLNPLLSSFEDFGVRKGSDGVLYISKEELPSTKALATGTIADLPSNTFNQGDDEYVEYTQFRDSKETIILIEQPSGKKGQGEDEDGVLIRCPNLLGGMTGYYLIEGDVKLRSGDLEDRYDPPLRHLMNEAQHYNMTRTVWEAMAMSEATRGIYQLDENDAAGAIEPHDPTQETKSAATEDGKSVPLAAGEVKRVEGFGQKMEAMLEHAIAQMHEARPTDIWGGTGASSETGIAIARRETALLTKLTPYQSNRATVCKKIHEDVDRYVCATEQPIVIAYLPPEATSESKPEVRKITPKSAKLPADMDYSIGSDTPESKAAREQMSSQRLALGVYGMTTHREEIGIKDPTAVEQQKAVDDMITMLLGGSGQPGIVQTAFSEVMQAYAKAALERELGPMPTPPQPILDPNQPNAQATQIAPENAAPPSGALQTIPETNGIPVTPGGPVGSA